MKQNFGAMVKTGMNAGSLGQYTCKKAVGVSHHHSASRTDKKRKEFDKRIQGGLMQLSEFFTGFQK